MKVTTDALVAVTAFMLALLLRGDLAVAVPMTIVWPAVWIVVSTQLLANYVLGAYRAFWHYTSLREARGLFLSAVVSAAFLATLSLVGALNVPPGTVGIDAALFLLGTAGVRVLRKMQVIALKKRQTRIQHGRFRRVLMLGAGDTANSLLSDLQQRNHHIWNVVGLLDDDPRKHARELHGVSVLGPTTDLDRVIKSRSIDHVIVAMPSADPLIIRSLVNRAQGHGVTVNAVPAIDDFMKRPGVSFRPAVTLNDLVDSSEVKETLLARMHPDQRVVGREKTILVTGGAGYIGSHLVKKLLHEGYHVRVLDNFMYGAGGLREVGDDPRLTTIAGDISSIRDVVSAVKDADVVIALAAIVGDPACGINAEETLNLNYESTKILVEACNFYGVKRLVFASSCSVYGASDDQISSEESALRPVSLYARTRILSEDVVFDRCGDVAPVVLRLSTVFGWSRRMRFDLVVNALTVRAVVDGRIQIFGGDQWRPFVHCADAAEAFRLAATAPDQAVRGEIFNVGNGAMNYTISQVGELVASEIPGTQIEFKETVDDLRNYRVSFDKVSSRLGFQTGHDIVSGIREIRDQIELDASLRQYMDPRYSNVKVMKDRFDALAGQLVQSG